MKDKNKNKRSAGYTAENLVSEYLRVNDYEIVEQNCYIHRFGELDIVARDTGRDEIVFVEVRSRTNTLLHPSQMITESKKKRLIRLARLWLLKNRFHENKIKWRIDLIVVSNDIIETWFKYI